MLPPENVEQLQIDLGTIKRTVSLIQLIILAEFEQSLLQLLLRQIPVLDVPEVLLRTRGQLQHILEPEHRVNIVNQIQHAQNLRLNLVRPAKDMRIVLLEPSHSSQSRQRSVQLVPVQDTKISHPDGQIPVGMLVHVEHDTVTGTIHGLETVLLPRLLVDEEDVLFVLEVVTADLPELRVVNVGRNHLAVTTDLVLGSHELNQTVVDNRSVWVKQSTTGSESGEIEQVLFRTDVSVVPLGQLLLLFDVIIHLTLLRIRNGIDPLQVVVVLLPQPIGRRVFSHLKSLNLVSRRQVRTCAQINQVSASVGRSQTVLWNLTLNQRHFEWVIGK
jgi:hypothetical protein